MLQKVGRKDHLTKTKIKTKEDMIFAASILIELLHLKHNNKLRLLKLKIIKKELEHLLVKEHQILKENKK